MSTSHFHFNSGSLPTAGATDDSNTDFNDDMLLLDTAPADDTLMSSDMLLLNPQPDAALLNANNNNNNMDMDLDNATSTAKLIQLLTQWWINEKTSPAILPFQFEVVEPLADCLLERADAVASSRQNIRSTDALVCAELMELEVERIKYLLKSYLLARLRKVELFADEISAAVNKSPLLQDCLSQPELEYAQSKLRTSHLKDASFEGLNRDLTAFPKTSPSIDQRRHPVFIRCLKNIGQVMLDDGLSLPMRKGEIYLIQFGFVSQLLATGHIQFI